MERTTRRCSIVYIKGEMQMITRPEKDDIIEYLFKLFDEAGAFPNTWSIFRKMRGYILIMLEEKPFTGQHDHMCPCGEDWMTGGQADIRTTKVMINKWCDETNQPNEVLSAIGRFWDWADNND